MFLRAGRPESSPRATAWCTLIHIKFSYKSDYYLEGHTLKGLARVGLIGFSAALRRGELVALNVGDIEAVQKASTSASAAQEKALETMVFLTAGRGRDRSAEGLAAQRLKGPIVMAVSTSTTFNVAPLRPAGAKVDPRQVRRGQRATRATRRQAATAVGIGLVAIGDKVRRQVARFARPAIFGTLAGSAAMNAFAFAAQTTTVYMLRPPSHWPSRFRRWCTR